MEQRLTQAQDYIIAAPEEYKGRWNEAFSAKGELYLEIGCGKGQFLLQHASENPDANYIGIEGQESVIIRGVEGAKAMEVGNVKFSPVFVRRISDMFETGELTGIYLNFSDPWPKARHMKRRLTHGNYLREYKKVLRKNGFIQVKTDHDPLYFFTLEQAAEAGLTVAFSTMDLHSSVDPAREITTEYEDKFREAGKAIHYVRLI